MSGDPKFVIVGGGLGGALMAVYLGRAGHDVEVHELRADLRTTEIAGGRSINLALSHRGLCALERVGLAEDVLGMAIPMRGRMIHAVDGHLSYQPYGKDRTQAIHSVSRAGLNIALLNAAEKFSSVRLFFQHKCQRVDPDTGAVDLEDVSNGQAIRVEGRVIVSADGAFSAVRGALQKRDRFDFSQSYLAHGYKELTIPAGPDGGFALEKYALHIWPRGTFMMIALPNFDGSFTVTLFWPFEGPNSFGVIRTREELLSFFGHTFADAVPLMPTLAEDYFANPTGSLVTVRCAPWHVEDRVVLLGDAAHAIVPFYGQGMNAAFEDVLVLDECMTRHRDDRRRAFGEFFALRKEHTDALADLAVANFVEMRDHTGSRMFLLKKKAEKWLHKLFPRWYIPLYTLVTFTRTPYAGALRRARRQNHVVVAAAAVLLMAALVIVARLTAR